MARDSETTTVQKKSESDKGLDPQVEYGQNITLSRQRTQSEVIGEGGLLQPTPENYVAENPTAFWFRSSKTLVKYLERNAIMRFVGGIGPYYAHKYRSWIMGCSAFLSFTCLSLLVVVLISCMTAPDVIVGFSWAKGQAHWKLLAPMDWTDRFYLGLGGMTNQTKNGDTYFVKYSAVECTEVFSDACNNCNSAGVVVLAFVSVSIACVVPAFFLDVHRIFQYFDLNFSKMAALWLHLVFGVIFTVLAYITFLSKCFSTLPLEAVHMGDGRKGVGMYLSWELSSMAYIMLAVVVITPVPGLLHLLVPTPSWANNKGLKAARARQNKAQTQVMDPFDTVASGVMRGGSMDPAEKFPSVRKPMPTMRQAYAANEQTSVVSGVARETTGTGRKESRVSELSVETAVAPGAQGLVGTLATGDMASVMSAGSARPFEDPFPDTARPE